jgi:hypothetical protein
MSQHLKADLARAGLLEGAPLFLNTADAAKMLGVSASFLNKARVTGNGPPYSKLGFSVRYSVQALLDWAAAQSRTSTSDDGIAA